MGEHPEIRRELFGVRTSRDQALSLVDRSDYQKGLTAHRCWGGSLWIDGQYRLLGSISDLD
nr:MAG TPA: hypothetical protein [Bacteriophage sp.]